MKRILVMSDTHGSKSAIERVLKSAGEDYYMILHAGDHNSDIRFIEEFTDIPVRCVKGNCDMGGAPSSDVIDVMGHKIFLTHGHKYADVMRLSLAAQEKDCKIAVFGHTHCSMCAFHGGVLVVNPGSPARPRDGSASYAILSVSEHGVNADIHRL